MGKKLYIKPEIREESSILTVRAFVTAATVAAQDSSTSQAVLESDANVWVQDAAQDESSTGVATIDFWAAPW